MPREDSAGKLQEEENISTMIGALESVNKCLLRQMQSIINSDQLGCGNYPAGPALENFG